MLIVGILQLCGLIALAFLVTPLMFYLIGTVVSIIVLTANLSVRLTRQESFKNFPKVFKKFLWPTTGIIYQSDKTNSGVYPPDLAHSVRVDRKNGGYTQAVCNLEAQDYRKRSTNNSRLYLSKQPITNSFHNVILFYRNFYGPSTKVEKNPFAGRVMLKSSKGTYGKC